jgi:maleate cis-trans isomerase
MYGWRARVGYVSGGTGEVVGEELFKASPKGVEILHGNLFLREENPEACEGAPSAMEEMAKDLAKKAEVDILVVAGYFLPALGQGTRGRRDLSWDLDLIRRLENLTKKPVIIGIAAQVEAMQTFKIRRPLVVVPGPVRNFGGLEDHLREKGFEVASLQGIDVSAFGDPYRIPLHVSYRFAKEAFLKNRGADGLLFSESTFPAAPNVIPLEQDLGVPVLIDSLCCLWSCLRRMHINTAIT